MLRARRRGMRAISPVIVTILLIAVGIALVLVLAGPLRQMVGMKELVIKKQESYIYTIGNEVRAIISLANNNGKINIASIEVETDTGVANVSKIVTGSPAIGPRKSVILQVVVDASPDDFGAKDAYKVSIIYTKADGSQGAVAEVLPFKS